MTDFETSLVSLDIPAGCNLILGQSHFIKTVEDLYEALASSSSTIKFGIGFCESSGPALVRRDGNDSGLEEAAAKLAYKLSSGHCFVILMKDAYPINVLGKIRNVDEVVCIYCATANPVQVILSETSQGRGILGVIDGVRPKGIEGEEERKERHRFLRSIGYKR